MPTPACTPPRTPRRTPPGTPLGTPPSTPPNQRTRSRPPPLQVRGCVKVFDDLIFGNKPLLNFGNNPKTITPNFATMQVGHGACGTKFMHKVQQVKHHSEAMFAFKTIAALIHNPVQGVASYAFVALFVRNNIFMVETVYEFVEGRTYLHSQHSKATNERVLDKLWPALGNLHTLGLTHNDIRPPNIIVEFDAAGSLVAATLIDLGCTPEVSPNNDMTRAQLQLLFVYTEPKQPRAWMTDEQKWVNATCSGVLTPAEKDVFNLFCFCDSEKYWSRFYS